MDKAILKFGAVAYHVGSGTSTYTGYRPQLEQLLHDIRSFVKICLEKSCADGRPRRSLAELLELHVKELGLTGEPSSTSQLHLTSMKKPKRRLRSAV